jgi:hypothetical protein
MWNPFRPTISFFSLECCPPKVVAQNSPDASARNSMWKQDAPRLGSRPLTPWQLPGSIWDRSTKSHASSGLAYRLPLSGDVRDLPKIADGASELLQDVFGKDRNPSRLVYGVASLPLGTPVELEIIFEVA